MSDKFYVGPYFVLPVHKHPFSMPKRTVCPKCDQERSKADLFCSQCGTKTEIRWASVDTWLTVEHIVEDLVKRMELEVLNADIMETTLMQNPLDPQVYLAKGPLTKDFVREFPFDQDLPATEFDQTFFNTIDPGKAYMKTLADPLLKWLADRNLPVPEIKYGFLYV